MPEWLNQPWIQEIWKITYQQLPTAGMALGLLLGGWLIALVIRASVFAALKRTTIDNRIADLLGVKLDSKTENVVERAVANSIYYMVLAFVLVAFFGFLKIDAVTAPFLTLLNDLARAVPQILKALVIGVVGFLVAIGVRRLLLLVLAGLRLDERLGRMEGEAPAKSDDGRAVTRTLADVAYWFIIVVAAIPVLESLQIGALATPLSSALATVTTYLPKVGGAVVLLVVGLVAARVVRGLVAGVLERVGLDALVRRFVGPVTGEQTLSGIAGTVAMVFVLLHFVTSAVGRLEIQEISEPLALMLRQIYDYLPKLFIGLVLLALGVMLARVVGNVSARLLAAMGFNTLLSHIGVTTTLSDAARAQEEASKQLVGVSADEPAGGAAADGATAASGELFAHRDAQVRTPADIAGVVLGAVVFLLFLRQVLETLRMEGLALLLDGLLAYLPNVLVAAVVLGAAMWAGGWTHQRLDELTQASKDRLLKASGVVARVVIVAFGAMVGLQQLGVGQQLIAIAFALVLGSVALALALAFGLGGREVAGKILEKEYQRRNRL